MRPAWQGRIRTRGVCLRSSWELFGRGMRNWVALVLGAGMLTTAPAGAQEAQLTVSPQQIVSPVSPTLYGLMTEEINHAFEGGLYAEMVQNRTMRTSWQGIEHWALVRHGEAEASMAIDKSDGPSKALPTSLKLTASSA